MNEPTFTPSQIFKHMTPGTLCAWVSDFDENPEHCDDTDLALMSAAIMELFGLVGMEALAMLDNYGIDANHPLVLAAVEAWNEDGE